MAISFIAAKEFNTDTDAASYTITDPLPTGLQTGDLCILAIACPASATGTATMSGWNLVRQVNDGSDFHRASIWYRVIQAGDTTTTDFTFDPPGTPEGCAWISSLYRGARTDDPFQVEDAAFSDTDADNVLDSPTVSASDPTSWVVSAGFSSDTNTSDSTTAMTITASGWTPVERGDIDGGETSAAHSVGFYDSNGTVSTGDKSASHTVTSTNTDVDMVSWIGVLRAPVVNASAEVDTATVATNAPLAGVGAKTL